MHSIRWWRRLLWTSTNSSLPTGPLLVVRAARDCLKSVRHHLLESVDLVYPMGQFSVNACLFGFQWRCLDLRFPEKNELERVLFSGGLQLWTTRLAFCIWRKAFSKMRKGQPEFVVLVVCWEMCWEILMKLEARKLGFEAILFQADLKDRHFWSFLLKFVAFEVTCTKVSKVRFWEDVSRTLGQSSFLSLGDVMDDKKSLEFWDFQAVENY